MNPLAKFFAVRNWLTLVLLTGVIVLSAQSNDKINIRLAKTAFEKYRDYKQAEKYLNAISSSSPYRDSTDFLLLSANVNTAIADSAKTPNPDYYKAAMQNIENLYSITKDESLTDRITDLKYKYDKSKDKQLTGSANSNNADTSAAKIYVPTASERKKIYWAVADNVLHKPTWHVGLKAGFDFDRFNYAAQQTSHAETTSGNKVIGTAFTSVPVYEPSPGVGVVLGLVCHPYISDYAAIGIHCEGVAGTTPLIFLSGADTKKETGSQYSNHTTYLYWKLNYGAEITAGFPWVKFLAAYDHSLRHTALSYFEDAYYSSVNTLGVAELTRQNGQHKIKMEWRHEEITLGIRLFPYSKDKLHIKNPCLLDLAYTINRDYDFAFKNSNWNYNSLNNFYHGAKLKLWVENRIGCAVSVSFPPNYFKAKDAPVNIQSTKRLPFITVSLFYNLDFFGLGYK